MTTQIPKRIKTHNFLDIAFLVLHRNSDMGRSMSRWNEESVETVLHNIEN